VTAAGNAVSVVNGATLALTATVTPSDYDDTYYKVVFSSGNNTIATVNATTGVVTGALVAAEVVITASFVLYDDGSALDPAVTGHIHLAVVGA